MFDGCSLDFQWIVHGFSIGFRWIFEGFSMDFRYVFDGFLIDFQWNFDRFSQCIVLNVCTGLRTVRMDPSKTASNRLVREGSFFWTRRGYFIFNRSIGNPLKTL